MSNRLAAETSPYLLQHADNPVEWHPWDEQALSLGRERQCPILLSIGYSACHWCHVMAHESFEDPDVAREMNRRFVNVKVDREERPDLDRVYQLAHQLLTRQAGGWPLTMFLDPDSLVPFFGGTYFPKTPRYGLPGFVELLQRIAEIFATRRGELTAQNDKIHAVLGSLNDTAAEAELTDRALLDTARRQLGEQYDSAFGGFGSAPKFPMPATLERLLRGWAAAHRRSTPDRDAAEMVMTTLTRMARGGIRDHLGGGFCRYATDRQWMVPHFEKMLYDNGLLLALYSDALGLGPDPLLAEAVTGTADWLLREMQHPDGGIHAALDADSEGEEGKYYVWRRDEVKRLLDDDELSVVETLYGLDKPANFEGRWNLHRYDAWASVVARLSLPPERADALLASARQKLLAARQQRVPPSRDDKILTGWNGLAITGLARAAARLQRPDWLAAAQRAADFLRERVYRDGVLHATWQSGGGLSGAPRFAGYLDDHAFLLDGLLNLLAVDWRDADLAFARSLADDLLARFEDRDRGGFFFTAHDHEHLIHRPKPSLDDATPAGNGIAALALTELGHLLADERYLAAAERTLTWARPMMEQHPAGHGTLLTALEARLDDSEQIIVRGPRDALAPWLDAARAGYRPWRRVYGIPREARQLPPYLPRMVSADAAERVVAYRCEGLACSAPIESLEAFTAGLNGS